MRRCTFQHRNRRRAFDLLFRVLAICRRISPTLANRNAPAPLPETSAAALLEWKHEMDNISQFISQCCLLDPSAETPSKTLYDSYVAFAEENGYQQLSAKNFKRALIDNHGCQAGHNSKKTVRVMKGIDLITPPATAYSGGRLQFGSSQAVREALERHPLQPDPDLDKESVH